MSKSRKYVVEYTLPYKHIVRVGITAGSPEEAESLAEEAFNDTSLWDNTPKRPLLYDDYEEEDDGGAPLIFTATPVEAWPREDGSVTHMVQTKNALEAARLLVEAYKRGEENGGSIDWSDVDTAYEAALKALSESSPPRQENTATAGAGPEVG